MTQIINEKLKKCCNQCNKYMDSPCAWLSLGNEYCDEIMEVNEEIERLNKDRNKLYENGLNNFLELQKKREENERLNNIIKEVREYIEEMQVHDYEFNEYVVQVKELLEILDKGE